MGDERRPEDTVPYVAHDEFRNGLAAGRWRIVVDPARARRYVVRRTRVDLVAVAVIGAGAMTALSGHAWAGLLLVALGVVANRLVRYQAAKIVLQLATRDAAAYADVTTQGVMEVRRAA